MTQSAVHNQGSIPAVPEAEQSWRDAVAIMTLRAKDRLGPELHTRINRAQALVLDGAVALLSDDPHGQARVASQSQDGITYIQCNGSCECTDATRAPHGYCKHRLAVAIFRRAAQHLQTLPADGLALPTAPLPEAPISISMKGSVRGRAGTIVTVRGFTVPMAEAQLDAAAALFDPMPAAAVAKTTASEPTTEERPVCREVPSALHAGAADPDTAPYCNEHDSPFYRNTWRGGKVSWSHRLASGKGFCRYQG